jgi:hypothetical protein
MVKSGFEVWFGPRSALSNWSTGGRPPSRAKAGLRDQRHHRVEAVYPARVGHDLSLLDLKKSLPDCPSGDLRMRTLLGVGDH